MDHGKTEAQQQREFGLVPPEVAAGTSGLDFLQGMIAGRYPSAPIMQVLGFGLVEVEHGRAVFEGTPTFAYYNPLGTVHGGYAATLLDSCMGCSVHTTLAAGTGYITLEFKVSLVRSITAETGRVRAEGRVVSGGRRVATAEGRLIDSSARLLAHATATCLVFALPARQI
jgi:uncharacterized protein (TIGR00369 family)